MPGIATHHVFGTEVYRELDGLIGQSEAARQAFLLGNLGPDPFFFLAVSPAHQRYRRLGSRMHAGDAAVLVDAVHAHMVALVAGVGVAPGAEALGVPDKAAAVTPEGSVGGSGGAAAVAPDGSAAEVLSGSGDTARAAAVAATGARALALQAERAYGLGFLCHYLLDSTVHPLVYAQQFAIAGGGVPGLHFEGPWLHRSVHATIETEIDEYVLTSRFGTNPAEYRPHERMLRCPPDALGAVSRQMAGALGQAYGLRVPAGLFATAVEMNRLGQRLLDSKSSGLRGRVDFFPRVDYAVAYVRALSHSGASRASTMFANADHIPWPHPYVPGEVMDASFDELYAATFERALAVLPRFAEPGFGLRECRALTDGVNFLGKRV